MRPLPITTSRALTRTSRRACTTRTGSDDKTAVTVVGDAGHGPPDPFGDGS